MTIQIFIPMDPVAKARARKGKWGHFYTPQKTRQAEEHIRRYACPDKPPQPYRHVRIIMYFHMPIPQSMTKKERGYLSIINSIMPHLKKPDLDNMEKLVMDALTGIFWTNDSVIWHKESKKVYAQDANPGIVLLIQGE